MARAGRLERADQLAATTTDEALQMTLAQGGGDTAQRELLLTNPNLTPRVLDVTAVLSRQLIKQRMPDLSVAHTATAGLRLAVARG